MSNWIIYDDRGLTEEEMQHNAAIILQLGRAKGWSDNAIAALCANLEAESTINPALWEFGHIGDLDYGYGLAQWTPATKIRDWILSYYGSTDYSNGDYQVERFQYEADNGLQYYQNELYPNYNTPALFDDWLHSSDSPARLAKVFLHNYERPLDQSSAVEEYRASLANKWYEYFTGSQPPTPGGHIPVWLLFKCGRRRKRL